jgi:hypothetical protein
LSSSVENSPPKPIEALEKNQAKIIKELSSLLDRAQRNLTKIFAHQREKQEELAMTQDTIRRIRAAQVPVNRKYTKRQVKLLSSTGILTTRDANRSIAIRKEEELAKEERKLRSWLSSSKRYMATNPHRGQRIVFNRQLYARERVERQENYFLLIIS